MNILKMIHEAALASEASTVKLGKNFHLLHFTRNYALAWSDKQMLSRKWQIRHKKEVLIVFRRDRQLP